MFKAFGNFINRTPWWAMVLLGFSTLLLLVLFAAPVHVMRLSDSGATPEERRAIKREIDRAFGDSALNVAENIVSAIKDRSSDPSRKQELEHALAEIAQARKEIFSAERDAMTAAQEVIREAQNAALDSARDAATSALEAAREARESMEEAKSAAAEKLKSAGADATAALKAFDDMIQIAKEKERAAKDAVQKINETRKRGVSVGVNLGEGFKIDIDPAMPAAPATPGKPLPRAAPAAPAPPAAAAKAVKPDKPDKAPAPTKSGSAAGSAASDSSGHVPPVAPAKSGKDATGIKFDANIEGTRIKGNIDFSENDKIAINLPPVAPLAPLVPHSPLPPELRDDIRAKVAGDVYRIGVGSAMVLAFIPIFIMMLIAKYFIDRSRRATAFAEQKKKEADVSNVNRQITEARLQALQAQVEPHFLYNTLANVQALTEVDPLQANQMTGHLIQYLRSSLPKMRENTSTVGQELELVRAYLNILKMRMGDRLMFDIDCPPELNGIGFPPMMLPSLVENAIKHGLEPLREGGRIDVVVQRMFTVAGERIRVAVQDTGRGLTGAPTQTGGGVGLSNIRERLIAIYGDAGKLTLESNEPKGAVASIEVPAETGKSGTSGTNGIGEFSSRVATVGMVKPAPKGWWGHTRRAVTTTHGVWAKVMSVTFITLMIALAVVFGLALAGLYTGMLPVRMGEVGLGGVEGMALGTLALLVAFGAVALVLLVMVGLLYGLGLLFAGLVIIIPLVMLISAVPALAPFVLIGLAVYWFWWRKRDKNKGGTQEM